MLSEYRNEGYRRHVSEERKIYMENIFHATTTYAIDTMTANRNKFLDDTAEMNIVHIVKRDAMRDTFVDNMNQIYGQMMSLYDDVKTNSQTSDRVKAYKQLMADEEAYHKNLKIMEEKSDLVEKEIAQLKDELHAISSENKRILAKMNVEKQTLTDRFLKLTVDSDRNLKRDKEMLLYMVVESEKSLTVASRIIFEFLQQLI